MKQSKHSFVLASMAVCGVMSSLLWNSAEAQCFKIDRSRNNGVFIQRPVGYRAGDGRSDYIVLTNLRSLRNGLGSPIRTVKILLTSENKDVRISGAGLEMTDANLRQLFGVGSRAIEVRWELVEGRTRVLTSEGVVFRLGGTLRGLSGSRSGTIGFCDEDLGDSE